MTDQSPTWVQRLSQFASIAAPTSVAAALLFYFGYVATYARYLYFGVDLAALDLSFTDVVVRGVEALFVPLLILVMLVLAIHLVSRLVRRLLSLGKGLRALKIAAIVVIVLGIASFTRGTVGVLWPEVSRTEFPGITPITLGLSLPIVAIGIWLHRSARHSSAGQRETVAVACLSIIALLGLFWATNSFASAYGRGIGQTVGERIREERPAIVLDTEEPLHLTLPGVIERSLPPTEGQKFRYRYRGLHVLTEAGGKLFLVSPERSGQSGTLVVPYDASVRITFVPR